MTHEMQVMSCERQGSNESKMLSKVSDMRTMYNGRESRILCNKHSNQASQEIQLMVWKLNIKEYVPGKARDTKEYFAIWTQAVELEYVSYTGQLHEIGYGMYISLLGILGKTSIYNSEPRKQHVWFTSINNLIKLNLVKYDTINYKYNLTSKGQVMLEVLARCMLHKGIPRI